MAGTGQMVSTDFSRFFRKTPFGDLDRIFWVALIAAILLESLLVFWMAGRHVDAYSEKEIARIQERFASFILQQEARQEVLRPFTAHQETRTGEESAVGTPEDAAAAAPPSASEAVAMTDGRTDGGAERRTTAEAVRESRAQIAREVSGKGLLALLTGTGSAAEGEAVSGIFSGSGGSGIGTGDLDDILGSVGGLKTQGRPGLEGDGGPGIARGGRAGGAATIDDLVTAREGISSEALTRKGDLHMDSPTEFMGGGTRSTHRSPEVIHEVLLGHVKAIQYCYERELKRDPSLKGKMTVRITVAPDGSVFNAEVISSTLGNDRVDRCIVSRIQLWKDFPPIDPEEGNVTFRQVYTFGY
ncbi:MAG TPA: energy transducer TonB [bacterium]|nr:energy transducer TonB [bacterium]